MVGDLVEDVVVRLDRPIEVATDTPARIERRRGGSAANVAVAAARAGCPVRFIGRVGDDALADQLVDELTDVEVDVRVQRGGGRTGTVVVLVGVDGERTMLPDRAVAVELGPLDPDWLSGVTWLHVPAYSLCAEPIASSTRAAVAHVRATWGRVSVDVSSAGVVRAYGEERFAALLGELAPDVVFANEDEAALVAGVGFPLLVVKHGPEPVELRRPRGHCEVVAIEPVPGAPDTTGAGDAFAGGFLAATLAGADPAAAVGAGAQAARAVLVRAGRGTTAG